MSDNRSYLRYTWFLLVMVFLVIIAGGVVRMTQSGMGCPDWPRCFGRWVPPTSASQLPPDFEKYLGKQDIDHSFNAYHTWIEYINRLFSALLGIFVVIHCIWSFRRFRKTNRFVFNLSLILVLAVGFQAWLGKEVVDANLAAVKVTTHLLMALVIAAIPLVIIHRLSKEEKVLDKGLKIFCMTMLGLLLVQIALGTQVREQIDEIAKRLNYSHRGSWLGHVDDLFLVHRSFSWLILAGSASLIWRAWPYEELGKHLWTIGILTVATVAAGITLSWFDMPALAQPIHILLASMLVMTVFSLRLRVK